MLEGGGLSKSEQAKAKSFFYALMTRRILFDVSSSEEPHVAFKAWENLGYDQTALIFQLCRPFFSEQEHFQTHLYVFFLLLERSKTKSDLFICVICSWLRPRLALFTIMFHFVARLPPSWEGTVTQHSARPRAGTQTSHKLEQISLLRQGWAFTNLLV